MHMQNLCEMALGAKKKTNRGAAQCSQCGQPGRWKMVSWGGFSSHVCFALPIPRLGQGVLRKSGHAPTNSAWGCHLVFLELWPNPCQSLCWGHTLVMVRMICCHGNVSSKPPHSELFHSSQVHGAAGLCCPGPGVADGSWAHACECLWWAGSSAGPGRCGAVSAAMVCLCSLLSDPFKLVSPGLFSPQKQGSRRKTRSTQGSWA